MPPPRHRPSSTRLAAALVALAAALALAFALGHRVGVWRAGGRAAPAAARAPRVALVIDDLGRRLADLDALGALGVPLSYAVLPYETRSAAVAAEVARRGQELLCHLPMEPDGGADPGPGALTRAMDDRQLAVAVRRALASVPGARGVNNHMGSRFTADRRAMGVVLGVLAEEGLFFLDSRTGPGTVGLHLARERGIPAAERQVFLDADARPEAIAVQFRTLLRRARRDGGAIGIGHPHSPTLAVLAAEVPRAVAAGYLFVPVSHLLVGAG